MNKLKLLMSRFEWVKILNSPFKLPKVGFYMGKTQIGIPYFLPRKFVKATNRTATIAALDEIKSQKKWNESNPKYARKIKSFEDLFNEKLNYRFAEPLKIGFSYCSLGWKTKWGDTDYRHEWNPILSFVFFGYQIALTFYSPYGSHYWEPWLYYEYSTDKTKSKRERIEQCKKEAQETWTSSKDGVDETIDYYDRILKEKYK